MESDWLALTGAGVGRKVGKTGGLLGFHLNNGNIDWS